MHTTTAMPLETFCPLDLDLVTREEDDGIWVALDTRQLKSLRLTNTQLRHLPAADARWERALWRRRLLISEGLFYQLVIASPAPCAVTFRRWVSETLLWQCYENTADLGAVSTAERLRHSPTTFRGEIERLVSAYLVQCRQAADAWASAKP